MNDILNGFRKDADGRVFRSGKTTEAEEGTIVTVLQQLANPDPLNAVYCTNLPTTYSLKIPSTVASKEEVYETNQNRSCASNITPTGTVIDLHYDPKHHIATILGTGKTNCLKLWLFCPPTEKNKEVFFRHYDGNDTLRRSFSELEFAEFVLQDESQAVIFPPTTLHATLAIQGGILVALDFTTPYHIPACSDLVLRLAEGHRLEKHHCVPIKNAYELAEVRFKESATELLEARKAYCQIFSLIRPRLPRKLSGKCQICDKLWSLHSDKRKD
ncbi:hypothetical protein B0T14DRAFT_562910 [Immersiella caudata]|uniref:JmjC domain-containing protein n=1 Tax=Immersiella caudata TaxID=314043 RepID=A0AA39X4B1_9PEZI|nr:hypothetical protein B0T14DRAFT_562910 [Immersiella caudata]